MRRAEKMLNPSQVSIVAELGINHNGSFEEASKLISAAAEAKVCAVKFQYRTISRAFVAGTNEIGDEILRAEIRESSLSVQEICSLASDAKRRGLLVGISFFCIEDLEDFDRLTDTFDFFKVPSAEFLNDELIDGLLRLGNPVLLSTGGHTEEQIRQQIQRLDSSPDWVPMHCVSNYPVTPHNSQIRYVNHLADLLAGRAVGFSSHEQDWEWTLLALAQGASVIERHITLDRDQPGLDHSSSSVPAEFARLVRLARDVRRALGDGGKRRVNQGEAINMQNLGRSWYLRNDVAQGHTLSRDGLVYSSPRVDAPISVSDLVGRQVPRDARAGTPAQLALSISLSAPLEDVRTANEYSLGIPVRPRDQEVLAHRIPVDVLEFHLSFGDLADHRSGLPCLPGKRYSVHAPDYVTTNLLFDPFSRDRDHREASRTALEAVASLAAQLQDDSGLDVPVIASFPSAGVLGLNYVAHLQEFIGSVGAPHGVEILPQWLPPFAWYFGGSSPTRGLNSVADLDALIKSNMRICLDVAHLIMTCEYENASFSDVLEILRPLAGHLHLADASGLDGEGVPLGQGSLSHLVDVREILGFPCRKILETWQGHLNAGEGFVKELTTVRQLIGTFE